MCNFLDCHVSLKHFVSSFYQRRKMSHMKNMKKKPDIVYIIVNILCLTLLIAVIELKNYFTLLNSKYDYYLYPAIMTNLAAPFIVCLLIVFRQSHHRTASLSTKIVIDSCSAVIFLIYNFFLFRFRILSMLAPESLILLCLFIVPAVYNVVIKIKAKARLKWYAWRIWRTQIRGMKTYAFHAPYVLLRLLIILSGLFCPSSRH